MSKHRHGGRKVVYSQEEREIHSVHESPISHWAYALRTRRQRDAFQDILDHSGQEPPCLVPVPAVPKDVIVPSGLDMTPFFNSEFLSDFKIICGNNVIPAHKIILATGSPVFNRMLQNDCKESTECKVTIADFDYETVMEMVKFMYTGGAANITHSLAVELLKITEKYEIMRLKSLCEKIIIPTISAATAVDLFEIADTYNSAELEKAAIRFIKSHFKEIKNNGAYRSLPQHMLIKLCDAAMEG